MLLTWAWTTPGVPFRAIRVPETSVSVSADVSVGAADVTMGRQKGERHEYGRDAWSHPDEGSTERRSVESSWSEMAHTNLSMSRFVLIRERPSRPLGKFT